MYENLSETDWEHVLGGLVGSVTNVGHLVHSLETPANPVVNSLGFFQSFLVIVSCFVKKIVSILTL